MNLLEVSRKVGRTASTLVNLAFAAAPRLTTAAVATEFMGAVLSLVSSYQIKSVVQAASEGSRPHALSAGLALAITGGLGMICFLTYARLLPRVIEAITVHLDTELVRLTPKSRRWSMRIGQIMQTRSP